VVISQRWKNCFSPFFLSFCCGFPFMTTGKVRQHAVKLKGQ
jgi:hypothetical protein